MGVPTKVWRAKKGSKVQLNVAISATVRRRFEKYVGPGRVLGHAVEQALVNEMKREKVA